MPDRLKEEIASSSKQGLKGAVLSSGSFPSPSNFLTPAQSQYCLLEDSVRFHILKAQSYGTPLQGPGVFSLLFLSL